MFTSVNCFTLSLPLKIINKMSNVMKLLVYSGRSLEHKFSPFRSYHLRNDRSKVASCFHEKKVFYHGRKSIKMFQNYE